MAAHFQLYNLWMTRQRYCLCITEAHCAELLKIRAHLLHYFELSFQIGQVVNMNSF